MKTKLKKILFIFICLILTIPTAIFAITGGGGTGSSGGNTGGASGSSSCTWDNYWQSGYSGIMEVGAYRFDLVYKTEGGGREIMKSVVAQVPNAVYCSYCSSAMLQSKVKDYVTAMNATNTATGGTKYVQSGPLAQLASDLLAGGTIDSLFPEGKIENNELIESYITSSQGFDMDIKDLQKDQDDNPGNINSYGYRIMIQKLQAFKTGCNNDYVWNDWIVITRKDAASNNAIKRYFTNLSVAISPMNTKASTELFTTRSDIGVVEATSQMRIWMSASRGADVRGLTSNFADSNNGSGYNILWFSTDPFKNFDYSLDAACVNCNNSNADNVAYTIKDTGDWDAINASLSSDNSNVQNHFTTNGNQNVLCREEFTVYFPNAKDTVYVEPGRYFVLHPSDNEIASLSHFGSTSIPNLKPVKVYRKKECQANVQLTQGENESDAAFAARVHQAKITALSNYESSNKSSFQNDLGTVYFRYTETYDDSNYSMDEPEEMRKYTKSSDKYIGTLNESAETLTMESTGYYTLPEYYYQYIRLQDGLSMKKRPSSNLDTDYKNVGISNLPVSYENHGTPISATVAKAADIQFAYDLPSSSNLTAAAEDESYLATKDPDDNIYEQYLNGQVDSSNEELKNSACAEFYQIGTEAFRECASDRTSSKSGSSGATCISKESIMGSSTSGYSCMVLTSNDSDDDDNNDDDDNGCDSPQDAEDLGLEWNSKGGYCCPPGTEYNSKTGKCEGGSDDDGGDPGDSCKTEEDASKLGVDWNPVTKSCCPSGTKYNEETGKCLKGNEVGYVCPESDCPYGCCPSGECAPMPTINGEPYCPGPGGTDVIYRTIDLENPFPGQDAENRETGSNWCSYVNGVYSCAYNNRTVKEYITREKSSGKKDGSDVYDNSHILYEVELDTATIKAVRNYNDKNKYDNWDLSCASSNVKFDDGNIGNGRACKSDFLKGSELSGHISGLCYNVDTNNFYSCDKDV